MVPAASCGELLDLDEDSQTFGVPSMKQYMLEYTREEVAQLADDRLEAEWQQYLSFSTQRQRLREEVQRMMRKKSPAQTVKPADIPEGGMTATKMATREVLLAKVAGQIYAIDNACGHSGYPLHKGSLDGFVVTCRWHDAQFDVRTGAVLSPGREMKTIKRYRVERAADGTAKVGDEL
jgi:nitrite reductase/ring-hydroxylating ferredoxin subunit